jgi:hypothetical protein
MMEWLAIGLAASSGSLSARAQQANSDAADLAKKLSNPVSDLVSVPFQFNWEEGVGDQDATRMVLNVQPVVPFELNDDWNLIGRWIMPLVSQPSLGPGLNATFGLGDIQFSAFFSPRMDCLQARFGRLPMRATPTGRTSTARSSSRFSLITGGR